MSLLAPRSPGLKSLGPLPAFPPNSAHLRSGSVIVLVLGVVFMKRVPFPALDK